MTTCNYEIIDKFVIDDFHCVVHKLYLENDGFFILFLPIN